MIELLKYSGGTSYLDIYSGTVTGTPTAYIDINNDYTICTITNISALSSGHRIVTTAVKHVFSVGDSVIISGSSVDALNETVIVTNVTDSSPYTFTYATSAVGTFTGTASVALTPVQLSVTLGTAPVGVSQRWEGTIPEIATTTEQTEDVTWYWTQGGKDRDRVIEYNVVAPYVHPVDAAYRLGFSLDPANANYRSPEEVYGAERLARFAIEAYTNAFFGNRLDSIQEFGQNTDILVVGDYINSVHKLYENDTLIYHNDELNLLGHPLAITDTKQAIRIQSEQNLIEYSSEYTGTNYNTESNYINGDVSIRFPTFRNGYSYIVIGQLGFQSVPSEIVECAIMLINDYLCSEDTWRRKYITDIKTSDWNISFGPGSTRGTGNATVDTILDGFARHSIVVI